MKKRSRITVLYAAPPVRPRPDEEPEKEPENSEYPHNYEERPSVTAPTYAAPQPKEPPMVCVYAGPDWFNARAEERDALITGVYACPDAGDPIEPEARPAEDELSEEERRILEELKNNPPAMMGLVQAPRDPMVINPFGMGMMGAVQSCCATPKFCPECGSKTVEGDKFCRECGKKFV